VNININGTDFPKSQWPTIFRFLFYFSPKSH
jgi:hypothetical protein